MYDRLCSACAEESKKNSRVKWKKVQLTMNGTYHLCRRHAKGSARTACGIGVTR